MTRGSMDGDYINLKDREIDSWQLAYLSEADVAALLASDDDENDQRH